MSNSFGIITLAHNTPLYNYMDAVKRGQYAGRPHAFIYNEPADRAKADADLIYLSGRAQAPAMIEKFIWFLKNYANKAPWDGCSHFVRANSSTFLNLPLLDRVIAGLPPTNCYAGSITFGRFISGTCIIVSRDAAQKLVDYYRWHAWRRSRTEDDLVIAKAMRKGSVPMIDVPMRKLTDSIVPSDEEARDIVRAYPLIRVRNEPDRMNIDLAIWDVLYRAYRETA